MTARRSTRLAWSLFGLTLALLVAMAALSLREEILDTLIYGLLSIAVAATGTLVASKHPRHPIGWLFCGFAVFLAFAELAEGWGYLAADEGLPAGDVGEWVIQWSWIVEVTVWAIVFLLFPDGRLLSRGWRIGVWLALAGCGLALPGQAMSTDIDAEFAAGENPFGVDGMAIDVLFGAGMAMLVGALLLGVASLVVRFRRAGSEERQQLKWFAYAASTLGVVAPFSVLFWYESVLVQLLTALAFVAIPVAAGIAILRYRLYDIDVVINRTLVYGALTATLAAAYLGSVLLLQVALEPVTADSALAVAASTLGVAALFRPARARIQDTVDRRFYRRKYDAARTLAGFGARVRDEVDLDALAGELRAVVLQSMQPASVSLWLRQR